MSLYKGILGGGSVVFRMLLTVEKSSFHDFSLGIRYIIKTYKVLGIPIYKRFIQWH